MKARSRFTYETLQLIKAQEYERFFERSNQHFPYFNHLGEVNWMTEAEAEKQHEFYLYTESPLLRFRKKIRFHRYPELDKLPESEKHLRLQFRRHLEKKYRGAVAATTYANLPSNGHEILTSEEIDSIPVTLEVLDSARSYTAMFITVGVIFLTIALLGYFWYFVNPPVTGQILVRSNIEGARVIVDKSQLGYAGHKIGNIPVGSHHISAVKAGYMSFPEYTEVEVNRDSMITLYFELRPVKPEEQGFLKISADYNDSKIFINNDYYGVINEQVLLPLTKGQHTVVIKKTGYTSFPNEKLINVLAGDTVRLNFKQRRNSSLVAEHSAAIHNLQKGTLEIAANSTGARIILNGEDTGKETDYFFTSLPFGEYTVELVKEGYRTVPDKFTIHLAPTESNAEARFELIKEYERVSIQTLPLNGEIFIDGKFRGKGSFEDDLEMGKHKVTFGNIAGYMTPKAKVINLKANEPISLKVKYFPQMTISTRITDKGILKTENCEVTTGYNFSNRGFSTSISAGPEIVYQSDLDNYAWEFGYAFPYRNPKGNDALKLSFSLPHALDYEQTFILQLTAAASRERYPSTRSPLTTPLQSKIYLRLNGNTIAQNYQAKFLEDLGGMEVLEWDITSYIKPGLNTFEISTTENNNSFYFVKSIQIHN